MVHNITMKQLINYCGFEVVGLAIKKQLDFQICGLDRSSHALKGFVKQDSSWSDYTKIYFDQSYIVNSSCTCRQSEQGPCIHIALLLLSLVAQPEIDLKNFGFKKIVPIHKHVSQY